MRFGIGYDFHRLEKVKTSSSIPIGGISIPCQYKVVAHSDGDVLLHAIIDAYLGSLALGDIGQWFSDTDPENKGKNSKEFANIVHAHVRQKGWHIVQVDTIVFLESPKLAPYITKIVKNIASIFSMEESFVSVKAKTGEALGPIGKSKGVAASAIVQVENNA